MIDMGWHRNPLFRGVGGHCRRRVDSWRTRGRHLGRRGGEKWVHCSCEHYTKHVIGEIYVGRNSL